MRPTSLLNPIDNLITDTITLGVTGFSRAGKTVFITSLAQALLTADAWQGKRGQGPLAQFGLLQRGDLISVQIRDDIRPQSPQFPLRKMRDCLAGNRTIWPEPTEGLSYLVLELEYFRKSLWGRGRKRVQLELIDYPGEWLMDLPMLGQSYDAWSERILRLTEKGARKEWSRTYRDHLGALPTTQKDDPELVEELTEIWTHYLQQAADQGYGLNQPSRLLRPDTLRHSPLLRVFPLPRELRQSPLGKAASKRYEHYKSSIIKPFYKNVFAKMSSQILLIDLLRTYELGEPVFDEMREGLGYILQSFRYGKGSLLSWLNLMPTDTTHVVFAATKADHVVRGDRANLEELVRKLLHWVDDRNQIPGQVCRQDAVALASVCATEDRRTLSKPSREILYGHPAGMEGPVQYDPGGIPLDMPPRWDELHFQFMRYQPLPELIPEPNYQGFPAINLGKALEMLIGEKLV